MNSIFDEAKKLEPTLIEWRRSLHRIPEVNLSLPETVSFITDKLNDMSVDYSIIPNTNCIVATIGNGDNCILLRSDMDALPMKENTDLEYKSENNNMHACGHDIHATILLGAAKILKNMENSLNGTVKLLFQPGEETFSGAMQAISGGVLENPVPERAFAMHALSTLEPGTIIYGEKPLTSVYGFKITIKGKGGHGSTPEDCIDPIQTAANIYLGLQSLIAREIASSDEAVLTIGNFQAGSTPNIIPDEAYLQGTLRTFDDHIANYLINRIKQISEGISTTYRTEVLIEELSRVPAVHCDSEFTDFVKNSISDLDKNIELKDCMHATASEDFAYISKLVKSTYFGIGASVGPKDSWYPHHNPNVQFNESAIVLGTASYVKVAVDWLNNNN